MKDNLATYQGIVGAISDLPSIRNAAAKGLVEITRENRLGEDGLIVGVNVQAKCIQGEVCGFESIKNARQGETYGIKRCESCPNG